MRIFLAGGATVIEQNIKRGNAGKEIYNNANILQSFYYAKDYDEKIVIPNCKDFMLDSGAFTFMQGKSGKVDWDDYVNRYADFINRHSIKKFLELDIDNLVGFKEVIKLRNKLEEKTERKPIPVWHKSRGLEQFKKDAEQYPYVAIGGIVTKEKLPKDYSVFTALINEAHKRGAKIHGLGFTNLKGLPKYHFDSVDSTAWVSGNRFGAVYFFDGKTMKKVEKPPGKRVVTWKTGLHNFEEWKKFGLYAETHFKKVRQPHGKNQHKFKDIFNSTVRIMLFNKQHLSRQAVSATI